MRQLLTDIAVGHAQPWLAALVWLVMTCAAVSLWHAIRRQDQRERRQRASGWSDHERRIRAIEHHLFQDDPEE